MKDNSILVVVGKNADRYMEDHSVLLAISKDAEKYGSRACVEVEKEFKEEFQLPDQPFRPFVNYFFYMENKDQEKISYHDNYDIIVPNDFDPKPNLEGMVKNYLRVGIPGTTIQMVMPPLIITNPESRDTILKVFEKFGYNIVKELSKN